MTNKRERQLNESWLTAYRRYIVKQESPDIFHFWVGMQMISAALKRNIYIDRDAYKVYPNQYVFLVADSGLCKKSTAMEIGLDLVKKIEGIDVVHGRMSVEGLIDYMDKASIGANGKVRPDGSVLIHADELAYLFGKASYITDLVTFFTAAYTSKAQLDFLTRNKGFCKVRNPCPSIITGTTPEQIGDIFPSLTLVSGFMARVLMIYGEAGARVAKPKLNRDLEDILIHDLGCISEMFGEIKLTEEVDQAFDTWYESMASPPVPELSSFYERKHDHVLKASLVISVAESDKMIIDMSHFTKAINVIEYIEKRIPRAISYIGSTVQGSIIDLMLGIIRTTHPRPMSRSVLLRRIYRRLTGGAKEFQEIIDNLIEQEKIDYEASPQGIFYTIKKKG